MPNPNPNTVSIVRARQIVGMWQFFNCPDDDEATTRDIVIDIFADIYHFLQSEGISWTDVVSNAEKWALTESLPANNDQSTKDWQKRVLDAIYNSDPLAVNDPYEEDDDNV